MSYDFTEEAELTNSQLAGELAKVSPLTADEVEQMLPRKADKQRLGDLINIVNSSASRNRKVAKLTDNIADLGAVVVRMLEKYFKPL